MYEKPVHRLYVLIMFDVRCNYYIKMWHTVYTKQPGTCKGKR